MRTATQTTAPESARRTATPARAPAPAPQAPVVQAAAVQTEAPTDARFGIDFGRVRISRSAISSVGAPDDPYEREADRVAAQVADSPPVADSPSVEGGAPSSGSAPPQIQAKGEPGQEVSLNPSLSAQITQLRGGGNPLPDSERDFFEQRFGVDFSRVRVHNDVGAAESAHALGANAYTVGSDVVFSKGQYSPGTQDGRRLIAHELTHVVQQGHGQALPAQLQRRMAPLVGSDAVQQARVHTGPEARQRANEADAHAVTEGRDIYFNDGEYRPGTPEGDRLIAHEVAHVAQGARGELRRPAAKAKGGGGKGGKAQKGSASAGKTAPRVTGGEPVAAGSSAGRKGEGSGADVKVLMPEPPMALSAKEQARINSAQSKAGETATHVSNLPDATANVQGAKDAIVEPKEQATAEAAGDKMQELDQRDAPSPEIEKLCQEIRNAITKQRPPNEESLVKADPEAMAAKAGDQQKGRIDGDVKKAGGTYTDIKEAPKGEATPAKAASVPNTPEKVSTPEIGATKAAPDAVPAKNVSLDADVAASQKNMDEAGMNKEPAKLVKDGPIAEARAAQGELAQAAQEDPAKAIAEEQKTLASAKAEMAALQQKAKGSLVGGRTGHVGKVKQQQQQMKLTDEQRRKQAGKEAEDLFTTAQKRVQELLEPLPKTAMAKWDAQISIYTRGFKDRLSEVEAWIKKRHSGFGGSVVSAWDDLTGLPGWVTDAYNDAERQFGNQVCELTRDISRDVNTVIKDCRGIIAQARKDITGVFKKLGGDQAEWAAAEQQKFEAKLDGLENDVKKARDDFNKDLVKRAASAVQEAREQIHALREKAKGLLGRIADAVTEFLNDPVKGIINGLLRVVGIDPGAFWAMVNKIAAVINDIADDPVRVADNLMAGLKQGFTLFFDNFSTHLIQGFLDWLFSGLRKDGLPLDIPKDLSAGSIIKFLLQLLGISWIRVRKLLVEQLGEKNVALLEKAAGIISTLVTEGIEGVVKLIKDKLDPQMIIQTMIETGVKFVVETLAIKAVEYVVSLLNPVGAIYQAVRALYKVLSWIFNNAARIFHVIEAVVNGIADVVAGNIGGMAKMVEKGLAMTIAPVIDFVAGLIGLDGLPGKIAGALKGLHGMVEGALRAAIGWVVEQGKKLLAKLGIGGKEKGKKDAGEIGTTIKFEVNSHWHKLYVETSGTTATLLVQSNPLSVENRLADWQARKSRLPEDKHGKADQLLQEAQSAHGTASTRVNADATQAASATPTAGGSGGAPDGPAVHEQAVAAEQALAPKLKALMELFGDEANSTAAKRFEEAQNKTELNTPNSKDNGAATFKSSDWQKAFEIKTVQAAEDLKWGLEHGKCQKLGAGSSTRYLLHDLTDTQLISIAVAEFLSVGQTSPECSNRPFPVLALAAFCESENRSARLPVGKKRFSENDFGLARRVGQELVHRKTLVSDTKYEVFTTGNPIPPQRHLPKHWDADSVRLQFYLNGASPSWGAAKKTVIERDEKLIQEAIRLQQSQASEDQDAGRRLWSTLKRREMVAPGPFDPTVNHLGMRREVDHDTPLAKHWVNQGGNNCAWGARQAMAVDENKLFYILGEANERKAGGAHYKDKWWVEPSFTGPGDDTHAAPGVPYSLEPNRGN